MKPEIRFLAKIVQSIVVILLAVHGLQRDFGRSTIGKVGVLALVVLFVVANDYLAGSALRFSETRSTKLKKKSD